MSPAVGKTVTFTGADAAHGGDAVTELMIEDKAENRATLVKGVPQEVSAELAAVAQKVEGHNVTVGKVGDSENGDG